MICVYAVVFLISCNSAFVLVFLSRALGGTPLCGVLSVYAFLSITVTLDLTVFTKPPLEKTPATRRSPCKGKGISWTRGHYLESILWNRITVIADCVAT